MEHILQSLLRNLEVIASKCLELQYTGVSTHTKPDRTVVSQADLFVQSALVHYLSNLSPTLPILAEETPEQLLHNAELHKAVNAQLHSIGIKGDAIELLQRSSHQTTNERHWCLDPIDGTRGFLRGDHYAIALAMINNGRTEHGFLCCPHLRKGGVLLSSGTGKVTATLLDTRVSVTKAPVKEIHEPVLIESVEMGPMHDAFTQELKTLLNWTLPTIRMDSQSKYGALVLGDAQCYLRLPRYEGAVEYAWDHAAGAHLVELAGGRVSDLDGTPLDFSTGAQLVNNRGVLATMDLDHDRVLQVISQIQSASI